MVVASELIAALHSELVALAGAPAPDEVVAACSATAHELAAGEALDLSPEQVALVATGAVALLHDRRYDGVVTAPGVAGWWLPGPCRVVGLEPTRLVRLDRPALEAVRDDHPAHVAARLEATLSAMTRERRRRDRLAQRATWPHGTDPLLQTRQPYTGFGRLDVFPVAPDRWPWRPHEVPQRAFFALLHAHDLAPHGEEESVPSTWFALALSPADGALRVDACWACRARSLRIGRELFDLPFRLGRVDPIAPGQDLFVAAGRPRLRIERTPAAPLRDPLAQLGAESGELRLVGRHQLPASAIGQPPDTSRVTLKLHTRTGHALADARLLPLDSAWLPHTPTGTAFRVESAFTLTRTAE